MTPDENELLVRSGPDTLMGALLRRFWLPVLLAEELAERDGTPVRVNALGEKFIAFRNSAGEIGLLDAYCTHRRANLYWGRNEDNGLRCAYHGWKFDVKGRCVDLPNCPEGDRIKESRGTRAYPTAERGGMIWAYFGPPECRPPLPAAEIFNVPAENRFVRKFIARGNWAQMMEGDVDSSHVSFLHSDAVSAKHLKDSGRTDASVFADKSPRWVVRPKEYGLMLAAQRNAGGEHYGWRVNQWLMPNTTMIAAKEGKPITALVRVPVDDTTTMTFRIYAHPTRRLDQDEINFVNDGFFFPAIIEGTYALVENEDNEYLIDRAKQRAGSFSGIRSAMAQDLAVTQDQGGLIADRSKELLTSSDTALVMVRRRLLASARALEKGEAPTEPTASESYRVRPIDVVLPRAVDIEDGARDLMRAVAPLETVQ